MENKWISVKDELPKNEDAVLIVDDSGEVCIALFDNDSNNWVDQQSIECCATHWMLLPEIPNIVIEEKEKKRKAWEDRSWIQDSIHYGCFCTKCSENFIGNESRLICRVCYSKALSPLPQSI